MVHLEIWNILETFAAIISFIAILIVYIAKKRFLSKEFKKIINWIVIISAIFFIKQVSVTILHISFPILMEEIHILRASFAMIIGLCFIKIGHEINRFSKVFGFAKPEEKFAEAFIKGVKGGGK